MPRQEDLTGANNLDVHEQDAKPKGVQRTADVFAYVCFKSNFWLWVHHQLSES